MEVHSVSAIENNHYSLLASQEGPEGFYILTVSV